MNFKAFSLTELSIVMAIIGIIASSAISAGLSQTESYKYEQTYAKMKAIEEAIAAFVAINRRLPCPGNAATDIDLAANAATYGIENFVGNTCTGTQTFNVTAGLPATTPAITDTNIVSGSLPTQALLLPKDVMLDGWGRKFMLVVSRGLANRGNNSQFDLQEAGVIKIRNFNNPAGNNFVTNSAAYVLISYGRSGQGSFAKMGNRNLVTTADARKIENSHTGGVIDDIFVLNILNPQGVFDDIISYRTKTQLALEAGATMSGIVCNYAFDAINNSNVTIPANILCGGTGGTGFTPSSPDCNIYMLSIAELVRKRCLKR